MELDLINKRIREGIFVNYFIPDIKITDAISNVVLACLQMRRTVPFENIYSLFLLRVYDEGVNTVDTVTVSLFMSDGIKLRLNEFRVKLVE